MENVHFARVLWPDDAQILVGIVNVEWIVVIMMMVLRMMMSHCYNVVILNVNFAMMMKLYVD